MDREKLVLKFIDIFTCDRFFFTVIEFLKLEKVEIGGLRGRQLSARIIAVFVEFNQYFTAFASKNYDVLDPDDQEFHQDFEIFQIRILELDLKLAAIFCQAFDDCYNLESIFKLVSIVGSVLHRPKIKEEFTQRYAEIVRMLDEEMTVCEGIFSCQIALKEQNIFLYPDYNFPPTSAFIRWCSQLESRITIPVKNFETLQHPVTHTEEALVIIERYKNLMKQLTVLKSLVFNKWSDKIAEQVERNLENSLIARDPSNNMLILNFSPTLFCILREVHYLKQMEVDGIPKVAIDFAEKNETYRSYTLNLEKTIDWYNAIQLNSSPVELLLIQKELEHIDALVKIGVDQLVWNYVDMAKYLQKLREPVAVLQNRMNHTQSNLNQINQIMSAWTKAPLFERKDSKKDTVLYLDERSDRTAKRYAEIRAASKQIHELLQDNMVQFKMENLQDDTMWVNYVSFVDNIVYENILKTVGMSVGYLAENMDPENGCKPLFESRLELVEPDLKFIPSLDPEDPHGFSGMLIELTRDILKMANLIQRLKNSDKETYGELISLNQDIIDMRREILNGVDKVMEEASEFCHRFERYSYLWLEDRKECMSFFLEYGRMLDQDEVDMINAKDSSAPQTTAPTIDAFREQIDNYESLFAEIEALSPFQVFNSWFQVDVRPFRQALLNTVCKWGNMFKEHLVDRVTNNLMDLSNFIRKADEGLLQTVKEGDYDGLVGIMGYLMQVKERAENTDEMFEPMQETIQLLKYYDMDIPEEVNVFLQELPEQWANTKKIASTIKQQVAPLQATEVVCIRNKIASFETHIVFFREVFKHYDFFCFDCEKPYILANRVNDDMFRLEIIMAGIQESGGLFEVNIPEFKVLKQCRKELRMLKTFLELALFYLYPEPNHVGDIDENILLIYEESIIQIINFS